ncbi:MAG: tetratricopeptide repeat protein [Pseudomonadota bacterium]|nr:tetratricopeptide repeat protein [Pseudomonadota bacterium]
MTLFISICVLFAAVAVAVLVWPLLRMQRGPEGDAPRANIAATVVAALLPLVGFVAYFANSNWTWDPAKQAAPASAMDLQQMITQLQSRLAQQPDDLEGWKLLGRSATVLGDHAVAREAFGEAYTRSKGQDPDAIVGYAESLLISDEREIDGRAGELIEQALTLDPDNARALWYGGIVAFRRGDVARAQQRWVELQNHDLPPDLRQVVAERLAALSTDTGSNPQPAVAPASTPTPDVSGTGTVRLSIDIAQDLAGRMRPGAVMFVIARRGDSGPPVAVVRHSVGAWPVNVTMTDANAMMPGTSLAGGGPLTIVARISGSGQPTATSGDVFGEVGYDFASASPVKVVIDRIVP